MVLGDEFTLTLGQLSRCCDVSADYILALVDEGLLEPCGREPAEWRFPPVDIRRIRTTRRLQEQLAVNLAGAALALELIDEVEALRTRVRALQHILEQ